MKNYKKLFVLILCIILLFTACKSNNSQEFVYQQGFEYHFYPDEYEEEYSNYEKKYDLEENKEYQIKIDADCESGNIKLNVQYSNSESKIYTISKTFSETILIPENTSDYILFKISIEADTKGDFIAEISSK